MHHELQLTNACQRLHLPAGAVLRCQAGPLWVTREARGPSPDIVLQAGQHHRVDVAGDHFLTHLRGSGPAVHFRVELPAPRAGRHWAVSLR